MCGRFFYVPGSPVAWLPRQDILTFEETSQLVDLFADLGVDRIRITGGEPLLRKDLPDLIALFADKPGIQDLAMTTNGILLAGQADNLRAAGLHRLTVSLDTLQADRFQRLTRFDELDAVLRGLGTAAHAGFNSIKIDTVVIRNFNDDEIVDVLEYGRGLGAEVRFIEYMDVGGATRWTIDDVVSRQQILEIIGLSYGAVTLIDEDASAPADRFCLPDGTIFGIISSTTEPFCSQCDRSRLTADGLWYTCLYAASGTDLRGPLRSGMSSDDLTNVISSTWTSRADRGAEDRLRMAQRKPLIPVEVLQKRPHLEMHTRGG